MHASDVFFCFFWRVHVYGGYICFYDIDSTVVPGLLFCVLVSLYQALVDTPCDLFESVMGRTRRRSLGGYLNTAGYSYHAFRVHHETVNRYRRSRFALMVELLQAYDVGCVVFNFERVS